MLADADVAEASSVVFHGGPVRQCGRRDLGRGGRVTRRLLSALGADDALEDEIRSAGCRSRQATDALLAPLTPGDMEARHGCLGRLPEADGPADQVTEPEPPSPDVEVVEDETVYELPEWLPEQRAQLGPPARRGAHIVMNGTAATWSFLRTGKAEVESLFERVDALRRRW